MVDRDRWGVAQWMACQQHICAQQSPACVQHAGGGWRRDSTHRRARPCRRCRRSPRRRLFHSCRPRLPCLCKPEFAPAATPSLHRASTTATKRRRARTHAQACAAHTQKRATARVQLRASDRRAGTCRGCHPCRERLAALAALQLSDHARLVDVRRMDTNEMLLRRRVRTTDEAQLAILARVAQRPSLAVVPGYPLRASPPIRAVRTGRSRASGRPLPTWLPIDTWMPVGPRLAGIALLASRSRRPRRALDSLT